MIVVTNSGPLMALAKLGLLDLLGRLYGKVYMPGAVYDEVVLRGEEGGFSDSLQVKLAIQRKQLTELSTFVKFAEAGKVNYNPK